MSNIKYAVKYLPVTLFGIYTADIIYRFYRYIVAYCNANNEFPKIFGVASEAMSDAYGFLKLSILITALLIGAAMLTKAFLLHTSVCFCVNLTASVVFVAILNYINIPWSIFFGTAAVSLGLYFVTGIWCVILGAVDLYQNILKIHFREK